MRGLVLAGEHNRENGFAVVARAAEYLELDWLWWTTRREHEEDIEVDRITIRVHGRGEVEDLEEIPRTAVEGLTFGGESWCGIEVVLVDGLGDRKWNLESSLAGEIG